MNESDENKLYSSFSDFRNIDDKLHLQLATIIVKVAIRNSKIPS